MISFFSGGQTGLNQGAVCPLFNGRSLFPIAVFVRRLCAVILQRQHQFVANGICLTPKISSNPLLHWHSWILCTRKAAQLGKNICRAYPVFQLLDSSMHWVSVCQILKLACLSG